MSKPNVRYYAKMELVTGTKTPKYVITSQCGYYPPMEMLRGRDGKISMFLMEKRTGQPSNTPAMYLQAKKSYNFTGLKDFYKNGDLSGYAYGYPLREDTYRSNGKDVANPFKEYKNDAYLFSIEKGNTVDITPKSIELIVLEGAKTLTSAYCKALADGLWKSTLEQLRTNAKDGLL